MIGMRHSDLSNVRSRGKRRANKWLTGEEFKLWRISRNLTLADCSEWFGVTPQAVAKYQIRGCSKAVAMAISAIERGLKPWKPTEADFTAAKDNKNAKTDESAGT
jgi:hypothetical protein